MLRVKACLQLLWGIWKILSLKAQDEKNSEDIN